jgi:hypothetical protein
MKKTLMIILLAIAGIYYTASAQQTEIITSDKTGWHKIGETTVNFQKESDEITVMGADKFASIKFKVLEAPIDLKSIEIFFDKGETQRMTINMPIELKGESRVINLSGGERDVEKIVFVYKTLPNRKDVKAHVEIWGLKTNADKK